MIIAYFLSAVDNVSFFRNDNDNVCCPDCGVVLNDVINPAFELRKTKYDFSYTYDGFLIVSERTKDFFLNHGYSDINFQSIKSDGFYILSANNVLEFDFERRRTKFINLCPTCNRYYEIIGATPVFLKNVSTPIERGVYRTDICFGTGSNKSPTLVVGIETQRELVKMGFNGCKFKGIKN